MHPYIVQVLAAERVRDMRQKAWASELARQARRGRAARTARSARAATALCAGDPVVSGAAR
jgi:hypothetical protein